MAFFNHFAWFILLLASVSMICADTSVTQSSTVYPSDKSSLTQDMAKSVPGEQTATLSLENDFSSVLMDTSVDTENRSELTQEDSDVASILNQNIGPESFVTANQQTPMPNLEMISTEQPYVKQIQSPARIYPTTAYVMTSLKPQPVKTLSKFGGKFMDNVAQIKVSPDPAAEEPSTVTAKVFISSFPGLQINGDDKLLPSVSMTNTSSILLTKLRPNGNNLEIANPSDIQNQIFDELERAMDIFLHKDFSPETQFSTLEASEQRMGQPHSKPSQATPLFSELDIDIQAGGVSPVSEDYEFDRVLDGSGDVVDVLDVLSFNGQALPQLLKKSQQAGKEQYDMKLEEYNDVVEPQSFFKPLFASFMRQRDENSPSDSLMAKKENSPKKILVSQSFMFPKPVSSVENLNMNLKDLLTTVFAQSPMLVKPRRDFQKFVQNGEENAGEVTSQSIDLPGPDPPSLKKIPVLNMLLQAGNRTGEVKKPFQRRRWISFLNRGPVNRKNPVNKRSHSKLLQQLSPLLGHSRRRLRRHVDEDINSAISRGVIVVLIPLDLPTETKIFDPEDYGGIAEYYMICTDPPQSYLALNNRGELWLTEKQPPGYQADFQYILTKPNGERHTKDLQVRFQKDNDLAIVHEPAVKAERRTGAVITRIQVLTVAPDLEFEIDPDCSGLFDILKDGRIVIKGSPSDLPLTSYTFTTRITSKMLDVAQCVSLRVMFPEQPAPLKETKVVSRKGTIDVVFSLVIIILFANIMIIAAFFLRWYTKKQLKAVVTKPPSQDKGNPQNAKTEPRKPKAKKPAAQKEATKKPEEMPKKPEEMPKKLEEAPKMPEEAPKMPEEAQKKPENDAKEGEPDITVVVVPASGATCAGDEDAGANETRVYDTSNDKEKLLGPVVFAPP
ncbi:uncharacterized protein LOC112555950 [Pomacea canaliculata]|uniref:uncharacterized protein LOC112555950 n=1 Tax=Pomacea canaliculata TaxID=400727 RepID=UPI000D727DAD|nr:uncharacterized protein LOC112555950 [Pomacea canaliculata]